MIKKGDLLLLEGKVVEFTGKIKQLAWSQGGQTFYQVSFLADGKPLGEGWAQIGKLEHFRNQKAAKILYKDKYKEAA